jgi:DNA replication protein DnaC
MHDTNQKREKEDQENSQRTIYRRQGAAITREQQKTTNFFDFSVLSNLIKKKKSFTANKSMNVKRKKNTVDSVRAGSLFHQIIYKCQPHGVWEGGNEST